MCDDVIHPSLVGDHRLTRRTLGLFVTAIAGTAAIAADRSARSATEQDVAVKTADGTCDAVLFYPSARGRWPAILIWPDVRSLRLLFRDFGRRLVARRAPGGQTCDVAQTERAWAALMQLYRTARA